MAFSESEIKNLLEFLERKYPKGYDSVDSLKKVIPPQINPNQLFENLVFCLDEHYVDATPIKTDQEGIVDLHNIKITSSGIRFLRKF